MSVAEELDLSVLRYSRVNEDCRVLSKALQICPEDIVLSITRFGTIMLYVILLNTVVFNTLYFHMAGCKYPTMPHLPKGVGLM